MPDISVGKSFDSERPKKIDSAGREYSKIEREYVEFRIKMQKSDFANSSSAIKKEHELLAKMKIAAQKEGLEDKIAEIEEREKQLSSLNKPSSAEFVPYYKPISFSGAEKPKEVREDDVKNIISSFSDGTEEQVSYLIKSLTNDDMQFISDSVVKAMRLIGEMGCHPNTALFFFEKFAKIPKDINYPKIIDLSLVDKFAKLKSKGIDDNDAIKVLSLFNENYDDKEVLDSAINTLADDKVLPKKIVEIIKALSINKNDKLLLSDKSIKAVSTIKNILVKTEEVEEREQNNPISKLNTHKIDTENETIIVKDNLPFAIYSKSEDSKKNYEDYLSENQDKILLDFAKKYRDKQGEIPLNAMRALTSLRRYDISMNALMQLLDFCYQDGNINKNNLNAVKSIKASGALSSDIKTILSSIKKDKEGNYDNEDMNNAQLLTKAEIGGSYVAMLLPLVRNSEDTLDLAMYLSQFTEEKLNVVDLIKLTKKEDGSVSPNSVEIIANLAKNFWETEEKPMNPIDFILNANCIINAATDPVEKVPSEDAAGICAIMCQNKETPENILIGLSICKNQDGIIDSSLADILWNMSLDKANIREIEQLIAVCKKDTGEVNKQIADNILDLYKKGIKTDKIMEIVLNTG